VGHSVVSTEWFIVSLLRPVLVLLLLAGSSAAERVRSADRTLRTIDDPLGILRSDCEHTLVGQGEPQGGSDPLCRGDRPNWPGVGSRLVALGPNGIRLARAAHAVIATRRALARQGCSAGRDEV